MKVASEVVWCPVEGQLVLFHSSKGTYFGLNEVGAAIWRELSDGRTEIEIVDRLQSNYDVDLPTATGEVRRLIGELTRLQLIVAE